MNIQLIVDDDKIPFLSVNVSVAWLRILMGIEYISIPCCRNSCIAYIGIYIDFDNCSLYSEFRCNRRGVIIRTFDLIPIIHRLRLQFANSARAKALREYPQLLQKNPWDEIRDYWDDELHKEHKRKNFFADHRDIIFSLSINDLRLFMVGQDFVWSILLVNLNLKLDEHFKKHNLLFYGIILDLNNPKDIHSFLRSIVDKLKALTIGIENIYDVYAKETFIMRSYLILIIVDLPAIAKIMEISGYAFYNHCRFCMI